MIERGGGPEPVTLDRRLMLLFLVPIGVYMLVGYAVLDATRRDDVIFQIIASDAFASVAAAEARYRSFWVTAFLLSAAASVAVAASTALGIWRLPLARDRRLVLGVILAIVLASVAYETIDSLGEEKRWYDSMGLAAQPASEDGDERSEHLAASRGLFRSLFDESPEGEADRSPLELLDAGLNTVKLLGLVALGLVTAGLVLTLAEPTRQRAAEEHAAGLARAAARQKELLQHGAMVYVLAIIAMLAWMHWPLPYLASDDVRGDYRDLLLANALVQGTAYSLGIAAIYLPAAMLLRRRIADLGETAPDATPAWLREQGLEAQPFDQLRQMATVLLPAIIGILPALEKLWSG